MKIRNLLLAVTAALALQAGDASAALLRLNVAATCQLRGDNGKIVKEPFNTRKILEDYADANALENTRNLVLVMDTDLNRVQIVNRQTGDVLTTLWYLAFGESIVSDDGRVTVSYFEIFVENPDEVLGAESRGTIVFSSTTRPRELPPTVNGDFIFLDLDEVDPTEICQGNIQASQVFTPTGVVD